MALAALVGLADSIYLTISHYQSGPVVCLVTTGCDIVLKSDYSTFWGVPVALGGVIYYGVIFTLALYCLEKNKKEAILLLAAATLIGLGASVWFFYLQAAVIGAYCSLCLLSGLTSGALFVGGLLVIIQLYASKSISTSIPEKNG